MRSVCRHIPRIKSHCAEERTLDRCVQRLRKKIMVESWEARNSPSLQMLKTKDGDVNLNERTPSFFQSPSLVCMGGLGVLDPYETVQIADEEKKDSAHSHSRPSSSIEISEHVNAEMGWGGMGLRGNHSFTNLHRSTSGDSGIFIDNEQDEEEPQSEKRGSWVAKVSGYPEDYIKTSHMANFYYRKTQSHSDLMQDNDDENREQHERSSSASQLAKSK